jgi:adenylate cyclase
MAEVFISYSKSNRREAIALVEDLRSKGFSVWIDQGGIDGAKNWSTEIVEAIDACSTLVFLVSQDSVASHNVAKEVQLASEKKKNILPVLIERVPLPVHLQYPLAGIQHVFYQDQPAILHALNMLHGVAVTNELPPEREADRSIRVAVMPFDDLSAEHDNQWFADGMMDELIATLGHIEHVKVPSRTDVLHYRGQRTKSREIAQELGVRYLVEGGVRKAQNKIRITTLLLDTLKNEQLWHGKFDGSFDDVFAFQESVSKSVADALSIHLAPKEVAEIEARPTKNAKAYELFLKGRHEQNYLTKESYIRALDLYEQAAALDPKYVDAYIGIASICCVYYREYSKNPKWLKRAETTLETIEALGGETSKSLYIRGLIEWLRGDNNAAIETLTRSTELDPKNHNAFNVLGVLHFLSGNYSIAATALQKSAEITENTIEYFNVLMAISETHDKDRLLLTAREALPIFERHILREPEDVDAAVTQGMVLAWANLKEEAQTVANKLMGDDRLSGRTLFRLGTLFDMIGQPQRFNDLLRKAIESGYREIVSTRDWTFETKDPACEKEFKEILAEFELIVAREAAGGI